MQRKRVILLGSTGSIGENTLRVADNLPEEIEVVALAANASWEKVAEQAKRYGVRAVAMTQEAAAEKVAEALRDQDRPPKVYAGPEGLVEMVRETEADIVVAAISGAAGLPANLAALETGKNIALANKESLVMSGSILTRFAKLKGCSILPVDSEHAAIFQCLLAGKPEEVRSIILTASGGPFRESSSEEMAKVTPEQALEHPTWKMGAKITIDSATLMNKSLEIIEAYWLFGIPPRQIEVVVHPQSIIHSMVEYVDGSTVAHLGPPDMRVPIQYALTYPDRKPLPLPRLRWAEIAQLTFQEPDPIRFPSLRMAYEVLESGGTAPTVFNGANEVAVPAFLRGDLSFLDIFRTVESALGRHRLVSDPTLDDIFEADNWAREEASRFIGRSRETIGRKS